MRASHFVVSLVLAVLAFLAPQGSFAGDIPINLLPMYGGPNAIKTDEQKKGDEAFIESATNTSGTRQGASKEFAAEGWRHLRRGDLETAMRRFNQAWLLDPNSFLPYWGFGAILMRQGKSEEAIQHYERGLSLINIATEKPRLLNDTAKAYSLAAMSGDNSNSADRRTKSDALFQDAIQQDPKYVNAYIAWIASNMMHKDYVKAWDVIKKARIAGVQDLPQMLIDKVSEIMPEPQ